MVTVKPRSLRFAAFTPPVLRVLAHSLIFGLALSIADLIFNFYLISLGYDVRVAGLLSTVNRAAGMVLGLPIGALIDRIGAQRALLVGLIFFSLGWAMLLSATPLWVLTTTQFIIGGAYILASTAISPLIARVVPEEHRPSVFGFNASATMIIGLLGSAVGGILPSFAGQIVNASATSTNAYRLTLAIVVVLGVAAMLPLLKRLPAAPESAIGALRDSGARLPIWRLVHFSIGGLFLGIGGGMILPFQNLFFRDRFGMDDATVGVVLAWVALGMGIGALLGTPVTKRIGMRRGAALLRLGTVPAILLTLPLFAPTAIIGMFLRGLFVAASYPMYDALVMQSTPERQRGLAMSMMSLLWAGGWAVSAVLSGWIQSQWGFTPVIWITAVTYLGSAIAIATMPTRE